MKKKENNETEKITRIERADYSAQGIIYASELNCYYALFIFFCVFFRFLPLSSVPFSLQSTGPLEITEASFEDGLVGFTTRRGNASEIIYLIDFCQNVRLPRS